MTPADLLYAVETEILKSIVSSLGRGAVGTAEWQADRLRRLGIITEKSSQMVSAYRARVLEGFDSEVERAAIEAALEVDARAAQAAKAGADVKDLLAAVKDPTLRATIATWQASARDQANLAMAQLAQNAGTVYSDIISKTALSVVTGATDGHKALVQTIREWSAQGIPSIVDKAGRQWTSEAYVNAVLRSNTSRAASEVSFARSEEYGTDLVEISSHPGSRPSHYDFQGKVYSRSGTSEKYPSLDSTGYGTAAGISGANCAHYAQAFWEGVSIARGPTQTKEENAALYAESQNQRALERAIRSAKREAALMDGFRDAFKGTDRMKWIQESEQRVRDRQAQMREFIDETGRTRRPGREAIYDA